MYVYMAITLPIPKLHEITTTFPQSTPLEDSFFDFTQWSVSLLHTLVPDKKYQCKTSGLVASTGLQAVQKDPSQGGQKVPR